MTFSEKELLRTPSFGRKALNLLKNLFVSYDLEMEEFFQKVQLFDDRSFYRSNKDLLNYEEVRDEEEKRIEKTIADEIKQAVKDMDRWKNMDKVTVVTHETEGSVTFYIPLSYFKDHGIDIEFINAALNNPEAKDAIINLIAGFALAAQTPKSETYGNEDVLDHDKGP